MGHLKIADAVGGKIMGDSVLPNMAICHDMGGKAIAYSAEDK